MKVTTEHVEYINESLSLHGVKDSDLRQDLVDHISTFIESNEGEDFDSLYQAAIEKFGGYASFQHLQRETKLQTYSGSYLRLKAWLYSITSIAISLTILGCLFKIMHWPGASIMLTIGMALICFATLPLFFISKYRAKKIKLS